MKILVSCKTTNLDVHGEFIRKKISNGLLPQEHLERLEKDHAQHHICLDKILNLFHKKGIVTIEVGRGLYWPNLADIDAVVTIGGDGTVLEASHHIVDQDLPIMGIRSSPMSVGYLCASGIEDLEEKVESLCMGSANTKKVSRLQALVKFTDTGGEVLTDPILNDFLYANCNPAETTSYRISLGDQRERHKSSGIWIATAAGSTAAINAAGGVRQKIDESLFQFYVREPYTPPDKPSYDIKSGMFDPEKNYILIENFSENAVLALDGQHGHVSLGFGDTISFRRAMDLCLIQP